MTNQYKVSKEDYNQALSNARKAIELVDGKVIDMSDDEIRESIKDDTAREMRRMEYYLPIFDLNDRPYCEVRCIFNPDKFNYYDFKDSSRVIACTIYLVFSKREKTKELRSSIKTLLNSSPDHVPSDSFVNKDTIDAIQYANTKVIHDAMKLNKDNKLINENEFLDKVKAIMKEMAEPLVKEKVDALLRKERVDKECESQFGIPNKHERKKGFFERLFSK